MNTTKKIRNALFLSVVIIGSIPLLAGNGNGAGNGSGNGSGSGSGSGNGNGNGGSGGGGSRPTNNTGDVFGDLYVVLRDIDGVPVLDSYGCIQPISASTGEVFQLYTNEAEDIYCELTEEMTGDVINVDFGRLNLGRAPTFVIGSAFDEAIAAINSATDIALDPAGRLVLTILGAEKAIDSPRENMALYIRLMTDGHWITTDTTPLSHGNGPSGDHGPPEGDGPSADARPVLSDSAVNLLANIGLGNLGDVTRTNRDLNNDDLLLAAALLAAAADKHSHFSLDEIVYINSIYGINQVGSLPGEVQEKTYFDFSAFGYDRASVYGQRHDSECTEGSAWTLVSQGDDGIYWKAECQDILGKVLSAPIVDNTNIRGFAQAAEDALRVIEFVHNFAVPEPM